MTRAVRAPKPSQAKGPKTLVAQPESPGSVLILDDDVALLRMLRMVFVSEGYTVSTARDGIEWLERLQDFRADIIILDLQMPGMDGAEFFKQIRTEGLLTPVVLLSAVGARRARTELGANWAIEKPFDPENLLNVVRTLLNSHER